MEQSPSSEDADSHSAG